MPTPADYPLLLCLVPGPQQQLQYEVRCAPGCCLLLQSDVGRLFLVLAPLPQARPGGKPCTRYISVQPDVFFFSHKLVSTSSCARQAGTRVVHIYLVFSWLWNPMELGFSMGRKTSHRRTSGYPMHGKHVYSMMGHPIGYPMKYVYLVRISDGNRSWDPMGSRATHSP